MTRSIESLPLPRWPHPALGLLWTVVAAVLVFLVQQPCSSLAADLIVGSGEVLSISSDTTYDNVFVQTGGVLVINATLTVTDDMSVEAGGLVRHATRHVPGLTILVADTLTVEGLLDVSGRGLRGGWSGSPFGGRGEALTDEGWIVAGAGFGPLRGAGASYGGQGGNGQDGAVTNPSYGWLEADFFLGSGGGGGTASSLHAGGGNGGGKISLGASTFVLNGVVQADGATGQTLSLADGGGGSGGSVLITVDQLYGTGRVSAKGGDGGFRGSGGGGGRIAIYYSGDLSLPLANLSTPGGLSGAASGTVYVQHISSPEAGTVCIGGSSNPGATTELKTNLQALGAVAVKDGGYVRVKQSTMIGSLTIPSTADISVADHANPLFRTVLCDGAISLDSLAVLTVSDSLVLGPNSTIRSNGRSAFPQVNAQGAVLTAGGRVSPGNDEGQRTGAIRVSGDFEQEPTSLLEVDIGGRVAGLEFDQLEVTGGATLDGEVSISFLDGFLPTVEDTFDIVTVVERGSRLRSKIHLGCVSGSPDSVRFELAQSDASLMLVGVPTIGLNRAPNAIGDSHSIEWSDTLRIDPVANDEDPDNDALTLDWIQQADLAGTLLVSDSQSLNYVPGAVFLAGDTLHSYVETLSYVVTDCRGGSDIGSIEIYVAETTAGFFQASEQVNPPVLAIAAPNPARSVTKLRLLVPSSQILEVDAFDVAGRRLGQVFYGWIEAGAHDITWELNQGWSRELNAGVYFLNLTAPGQGIRLGCCRVVIVR